MPGAPDGPTPKVVNSKRKRASPKKAAPKKVQRSVPSSTQVNSASSAPSQNPTKHTRTKKSRESPDRGDDQIQQLLSALGRSPSSSSLEMFPFGLGFPSVTNNIGKLVNGISSTVPKVVLQSLEDLGELILMSGDDIVYRLPLMKLVGALMTKLATHTSTGAGDIPTQRMLLSSRILGVLLDSSPPARQLVGGSPENLRTLIHHIANVELIELSDQCLVVLSRFSRDYSEQALKAGALRAVLQNMEFFGIATQHTCLRIVEDLLSADSVDAATFSDMVEPVIPRLSQLVSHPDSAMGARMSSCWRLAIEKWSRLCRNDTETDFVSPIISFLSSAKSSNPKLLQGLGLIAKRSSGMARKISQSEPLLNLCVELLRSDEKSSRSALCLVSSILPQLVRAESPAVISVDTARIDALGMASIERIGSICNSAVSETVVKYPSLAPFSVQIILVQLLAGVSVDSTVLRRSLGLFSDILSEYHSNMADLSRINGPLVIATIRLVREIGNRYENLIKPLAEYGLIDAVSKMACPAGRVLRRRKTATLLSPVSGSVWGPLIRAEATFCAEAIPMSSFVPSHKYSTMNISKFESLLAHLADHPMTGFEFDQSNLVKFLIDYIRKGEISELLRSTKNNTAGFVNLCELVTNRVERDVMAIASKEDLPDSVEDAQFARCLQRPLRLSLSGPDGADLFVMTEPLAQIRSMHDFLLSRTAEDTDEFDETDLGYDYESSEDFDAFGPYSDQSSALVSSEDDSPVSPAVNSHELKREIRFKYKGKELDSECTFFQAIARESIKKNGRKAKVIEYDVEVGEPLVMVSTENPLVTPIGTPRVSSSFDDEDDVTDITFGAIFNGSSHRFQYEIIEKGPESESTGTTSKSVAEYVNEASAVSLPLSDSAPNSLILMAYLSGLSVQVEKLPESPKLSARVLSYYTSPSTLARGQFPDWIDMVLRLCPQVLSLAARKEVLSYQAGGPHRAIVAQIEDKGSVPIMRQKIKIQRQKLIECALGVMNLYGTRACGRKPGVSALPVIEIEFEGEEGTGSGPTNEFYASVVEILKKDSLMLSACEDGSLFPCVVAISTDKLSEYSSRSSHCVTLGSGNRRTVQGLSNDPSERLMDQWRLLGILVGRCIVDHRLVDLNMHPQFWILVKQLLKKSSQISVDVSAMTEIDPALISSIDALEALSEKELLELDLDAGSFPGRPEVKLGTLSGNLTPELLPVFKEHLIRTRMYGGIEAQLRVFAQGISEVIPDSVLDPFRAEEISALIGGSGAGKPEFWTIGALVNVIQAAHGYTTQSEQFKSFIEILSELSSEDRISFVRFVTGSRSLPSNGFAGLAPPLTVVLAINDGCPDDYLPSVMTCANFVKLPKYTTKELMRRQLLKAMSEGQGSFLLS